MLVLFPLKAETIRQMEGEQHETMQLNVIKKLASLGYYDGGNEKKTLITTMKKRCETTTK